MASDLGDGDYLGAYRRFFVDFLDKVNPDDQLPIKTSGHDVTEAEIVGETVHMTLQYLNQELCPPSLQCYIVQQVIEEIKATCRKEPEACGFRQEENTYAPLKLMQAIAGKVNEICRRYLENSRLALLPPPPSTPMPLATAFAIRNTRRKMEDRHVVLHDLNAIFNIKDDSVASYYAVFDGHAGYQAAVYCAAHLHQYLAESRHYPTDPERALRDAFLTTDELFIQKSTRQTLSSGTTAVCALILKKKLYVAWVGDSQAALAKRGTVSQLVNPHKPDRNDERERVEVMGGTVMHHGIWRVNGNLAVSRAIGDAQYKPYVTGNPEISCITLDGYEDFLIIACDGLWDCVTENEAAALVYREVRRDPYDYDSVSQRLVEYAKNQGSIDNITVIVVFLTAPSKIASRPQYGNPLLADVQLNNMDPDNRFVSNSNGQFDVNSPFAKQPSAKDVSPDLMDDEDPYGAYENKSSNGKHHENGAVPIRDYDAEEDDDDLGPETDVDALDDVADSGPTLADVSRQLFPEKQDPCELYQAEEEGIDDDAPPSPHAKKTNQQALIPEADNVGDSEDSEDEWNYYRIEPNKEKDSSGAAADSIAVPKGENEIVESVAVSSSPSDHGDVLEIEKEGDSAKNDTDSCSSESDSEREVRPSALIDDEISPESELRENPPTTVPSDELRENPPTTVPSDELRENPPTTVPSDAEETHDSAEQPEETHDRIEQPEETHDRIEQPEETHDRAERPEETHDRVEQPEVNKAQEEDMDFQLNPNAAEFVPVSPTLIASTRSELDAPIAGSPLKHTPLMDDMKVPSRREFQNEVRHRPGEIEEKSCANGQLLDELDDECSIKENETVAPCSNALDESEVSSTKAEFGDESSFMTMSEFQRTGVSNLDGSYADSSVGLFDVSAVDPMTKSFGPGDFMALSNSVDLNAVHDLTDADLMAEESPQEDRSQDDRSQEEREKNNLLNVEKSDEPAETEYLSSSMIGSLPDHETGNIMDSSSPVSSLHAHELHQDEADFGSEIDAHEHNADGSISEMLDLGRPEEKHTIDSTLAEPEIERLDAREDTSPALYDETNVTSKLLEMDLEDRGSQDCGFEKCNETWRAEAPSVEATDLVSSPLPEDDIVERSAPSEEHAELISSPVPEETLVESSAPSDEPADLISPPVAEENFVESSAPSDEPAEFASSPVSEDNLLEPSAPSDEPADLISSHVSEENLLEPSAPSDETADLISSHVSEENLLEPSAPSDAPADLFSTLETKEIVVESSAPSDGPVDFISTTVTEEKFDWSAPSDEPKDAISSPMTEENLVECSAPSDGSADFVSSPLTEKNLMESCCVPESLPFASTNLEEPPKPAEIPEQPDIDEMVKSFSDLRADVEFARNIAAPDVPVLQNPLGLNIESASSRSSQDNLVIVDPVIDYIVAKAPESPGVAVSPLVDQRSDNPFAVLEPAMPASRAEIDNFGTTDEIPPEDKTELNETPIESEEAANVSTGLKLSESLQEFTGLEQQLNPEKVTNGLAPEDSPMETHSEEPKELEIIACYAAPQVEEQIVQKIVEEEVLPKEPLITEEKRVEPTSSIEELAVVAAAAVATAATAGTVAAVAGAKAAKAKPTAKTAPKSAAPKPAPTKSTPTSPTKAAAPARASAAAGPKKTASTAARPNKLETGAKAGPATAGKAAPATKSTLSAPKTTARLSSASASSPRGKSSSATSTKPPSAADKKPMSNGDATKSSISAVTKSATATARAPAKPLVKSTASARQPAAASAAPKPRLAPATANKAPSKATSATGTVGTTTQRPKTAPAGATSLAAKSRLASSTSTATTAGKSPITEKHIKETANKQISSSRTSTTTTASKTSRTSLASSTTTASKRLAASKTTSSAAAAPAVPPPIRKPAPISRLGAKTAAATAKSNTTKATSTTTIKNKVVQNGVCTTVTESNVVTSTTVTRNNDETNEEDVPKKDVSPVELPTDNQLIITAD